MKWYNLADVHKDKGMRDTFSSYRARIAYSFAQHARHIDIGRKAAGLEGPGRPARITLLTAEGIAALYEPNETLPKLKPYPAPVRLTDKARQYMVEGNGGVLFTTQGLEEVPREMDRERFIRFLVSIGNEDIIEPDFIDL